MSNLILGIDVSKDKLDVMLLLDQEMLHGIFDNDENGHSQLMRWLSKKAAEGVHACMEATGMYAFPVAEELYESGHKVSVVNPARISAYSKSQLRRNKTDKLDAEVIADFCRTQNPPLWTPPGPEFSELQALIRLLDDLQGIKQTENNRLKSGVRSIAVIDRLKRHIAYLDKEIKDLKAAIKKHVNSYPDLKRQKDWLVSIKGIGELTAHKLLGEIPDFTAFENARQLVAFAGLNPRLRLSGKMKGRSPISKTGNSHLRKALYMPALVAMKHNPIIRDFGERLSDSGKVPMEVVIAAMRKLLHQAFGVVKNQQNFNPNHELEKKLVYDIP